MRTHVWIRGQISTVMLACVGSVALSNPCIAQVIPDQTLPVGERSLISGTSDTQINGGAIRGSNLFHSFRQFSIPTGGSASFNNAPNITNIITRVTGTNLSNIDGVIRANGTANLFLINPNGIVFGANARLELGGSFLASTAEGLKFDNGFEFSAASPDIPPLLTISTPIGLQYGNNSGAITVQGNGHNLTYDPVTFGTVRGDVEALQVQPGKTLALVGGNVVLEGGNLRAEAGRIELGSVALGNVSINEQDSRLTLGYANVQSFGNIQLSQKASVDASGEGGGSIQLQSRQLSVKEGSAILSITTGVNPGGDLTVNATESVELLGESADQQYASAIFTESQGTGSSGNLTINTGKLLATDGAYASTYITSSGSGGNLTIKASDSVEFIGRGLFRSGLYSGTSSGSSGNSGDISISTGMLSLTNSAIVDANTFGQGNGQGGNVSITTGTLSLTNGAIVGASTFGQGNAGNITITASDAVSFDGVGSDGFSSGAFSNVTPEGNGQGGNVSITTGTLSLTNGGVVDVATFGQGNAGDITITASDAVTFDGVGGNGFSSGAYSRVEAGATGQGGTIAITTARFVMENRAQLTASSEGQGVAGNLEVTARQLRLDTQGSIEAQTTSGQGGNITLQVPDFLLLRRGSFISTTAGTAEAGGDGGNITLNSNLIVAVPQENSNITANAFTGRGGNIRITTQGLFGIEPRASTTTGLSSITASSQFGISGTITLNRPDVDPSQGLVTLPTDLQDTSRLIASTCPADEGNSFAITGRGGLPEDPRQPLMGDSVWLDDRATSQLRSTIPNPTPQIVEAQGWIRDRTGQVTLVATRPASTPQTSRPIFCSVPSSP